MMRNNCQKCQGAGHVPDPAAAWWNLNLTIVCPVCGTDTDRKPAATETQNTPALTFADVLSVFHQIKRVYKPRLNFPDVIVMTSAVRAKVTRSPVRPECQPGLERLDEIMGIPFHEHPTDELACKAAMELADDGNLVWLYWSLTPDKVVFQRKPVAAAAGGGAS